MVPGIDPKDVVHFNTFHGVHEGYLKALALLEALHKATREKWEVVRLLRVGWTETPATDAAVEEDVARVGRLAAMLRLRGLGRFRPVPRAGLEQEVVMPRARDTLGFLGVHC